MELDVVLCNHAETAENKLFIAGGGIGMCVVGPEPPHIVSVALGLIVHVPYQSTNQAHTLKISLIDEDGHPVVPFQVEGTPEPGPLELNVPFNVGRPPILEVGDEQTMALAANFANLPLRSVGLYKFELEIDGTVMAERRFRAMTLPPGFVIPGMPTPS